MTTNVELIRDLPHAPYIHAMQKLESYAECDEVLKSKAFVQGSHQESAAVIGRSLIVLDGSDHFERRRMESALFTRAALEYYETHALVPHIHQVISATADRNRGTDGIVRADLTGMLRSMLARITATITGIDGVDSIESTERFISYVEEFNRAVTVEWSTDDHAEVLRRTIALRDEFRKEFYEPSLARRRALLAAVERGECSRAELPQDLLMLVLERWDGGWDDELLLSEGTLFWVAATQTTTHAAPHVIRHLDAWIADHPKDAKLLDSPPFLKSAAYESLRLHVPVHALLRTATEDVVLSTGRSIAAGERVACCFAPANRDPSAFGPDANEFNPWREVGDVKPWGLSFGGGPHMCIGRSLVTGLSARSDGVEGTEGTIARILFELYKAGVEIDGEGELAYVSISHVDSYAKFPIRLRNV